MNGFGFVLVLSGLLFGLSGCSESSQNAPELTDSDAATSQTQAETRVEESPILFTDNVELPEYRIAGHLSGYIVTTGYKRFKTLVMAEAMAKAGQEQGNYTLIEQGKALASLSQAFQMGLDPADIFYQKVRQKPQLPMSEIPYEVLGEDSPYPPGEFGRCVTTRLTGNPGDYEVENIGLTQETLFSRDYGKLQQSLQLCPADDTQCRDKAQESFLYATRKSCMIDLAHNNHFDHGLYHIIVANELSKDEFYDYVKRSVQVIIHCENFITSMSRRDQETLDAAFASTDKERPIFFNAFTDSVEEMDFCKSLMITGIMEPNLTEFGVNEFLRDQIPRFVSAHLEQ